jgi:hypothetical protein
LILYGLIQGYLIKINKYPYKELNTVAASAKTNESTSKALVKNEKNQIPMKWLTGIHNYDKICSSLSNLFIFDFFFLFL